MHDASCRAGRLDETPHDTSRGDRYHVHSRTTTLRCQDRSGREGRLLPHCGVGFGDWSRRMGRLTRQCVCRKVHRDVWIHHVPSVPAAVQVWWKPAFLSLSYIRVGSLRCRKGYRIIDGVCSTVRTAPHTNTTMHSSLPLLNSQHIHPRPLKDSMPQHTFLSTLLPLLPR